MARRVLWRPGERSTVDDFLAPFTGWYQVVVTGVEGSTGRPCVVSVGGPLDVKRSMCLTVGAVGAWGSEVQGGAATDQRVGVASWSSGVLGYWEQSTSAVVIAWVVLPLDEGDLVECTGQIRAVHFLGSEGPLSFGWGALDNELAGAP